VTEKKPAATRRAIAAGMFRLVSRIRPAPAVREVDVMWTLYAYLSVTVK